MLLYCVGGGGGGGGVHIILCRGGGGGGGGAGCMANINFFDFCKNIFGWCNSYLACCELNH